MLTPAKPEVYHCRIVAPIATVAKQVFCRSVRRFGNIPGERSVIPEGEFRIVSEIPDETNPQILLDSDFSSPV